MKVVHVLESFFPFSCAGTEQYVLQLSKLLQKMGIDAYVISTFIEKTPPDMYDYSGIPVYRFSSDETATKKELAGLKASSNLTAFIGVLKSINPEIVHFHTFNRKINFYHLIAAKQAGYRTVFTSHLAGIFCLKGDLQLFNSNPCDGDVKPLRCFACFLHSKGIPIIFTKLISIISLSPAKIKKLIPVLNIVFYRKTEFAALNSNCDAIIALSPWIQNTYKLNGINNSILVLQGTTRIFNKRFSVKNKIISIGFIGRMYSVKGLHILLDALNSIDNSLFQLKIIYLPFDEDYLLEIKRKASFLSNSCFFFSNQTPDEVDKHLEELDVLCLPSVVAEMAPLAILEAFSHGVPVIGSNHGGIKDMVKQNIDGLLFENNNVKSLTLCLMRLLKEPDLINQLSKNIKPPRSLNDVANDMMIIYNKII